MKNIVSLYLLISIILINSSCKKEPIPGEQGEIEMLNEWIWEGMNDIYLWASDIDQSLYPTEETDPESFFYSLLHETVEE